MDMPLTKRQKEILDHLQEYVEENGYAPSFEEIASHFRFSSLATVHEHLENLKRKGYIRKSYNESRSIEVVPPQAQSGSLDLPLLGYVTTNTPIEAIENQEVITVPEDMLSRNGRHFVLRVKGQSMIDEQIRDGDFIVVNARQTANNGEMVVALVDQEAATVKKFYRENDGRIRLQPANPQMVPMYYPSADVAIQGIVVGVIRRY